MNYAELGYVRVAAVAPELVLADPAANANRIGVHLKTLAADNVSLALFPELALTGYTCEDLFLSSGLQQQARQALALVAKAAKDLVAVVGVPYLMDDGRLLNCAAVLSGGRVKGLVPKSAHPNYGEFYDRRWFANGGDIDVIIDDPVLGRFRLACDQLFRVGRASFAVELCEDLWAPQPPGIRHCLAGADMVLNLSASNELVAKADYRRDLVHMASARGICGYLYASSGPMESTKDLVFGGHLIACENGQSLGESERFTHSVLITEFDIDKLRHDRAQNSTFRDAPRPTPYQAVAVLDAPPPFQALTRTYPSHPFVPADEALFDARATEILSIQATGLSRRMLAADARALVIGLSGGLDSTLAYLVCLDALQRLDRTHEAIHALTLPGPGTTEHTRLSAHQLCAASDVPLKEISIAAAVRQHLQDLKHVDDTDVVFENAQARERTQLLFNYANKVGGIVVGTGDLSELALGWCTFNADHMASYNVNASVPKTMMAYLVRWYARHRASPALAAVLERVLDTPISPELIAPRDGQISQQTEAIIGPYELHDFFLYHYVRNGFPPRKIYQLARDAFGSSYDGTTIKRWLSLFFKRFFTQQFKRTTLPPGPKVGSVSLSPRGDWRMPDEAAVSNLLKEIEQLND